MVKCPFCGFDNEDGALFCEQCKSDLSSVPTPVHAQPVHAEAVPFAYAEAIPVEAIAVEAVPVEAIPMEALPVQALEAEPVAAEAIPVEDVIPAPLPQLTMPIDESPAPTPAPTPAVAAAAVHAAAIPAAPVAPTPPPAPAANAPAAPAAGGGVPAGAQLKLVVQRGLRVGVEFPIYADYNYIGRSDDKPVDIDLDDQEAPDRVWCSRQHAVLHYDDSAGVLTIEDLNSSNGTYVNRARVYPGQKVSLSVNDVIQIGTVHLKLKA
ncbi:MAG: FHA domain-containing protein [Gemmataceae bacterium]|nr:FHA domain-containing protein [Gemmataceae bacterium]